ncbi:MAG: dihydrolipoyllysine-residue acetyltransferase [Gammaproteobacteria bacterium]|nr:dihydrolipoyllysine-residue acetyltransferase [Gammaproteobacteria bacterium]
MAKIIEITVPDIGDFDEVEVIEVLVQAGDRVEAESSLITLESDKASMDIPSPHSGTIKEIKIKAGQKVSQGHIIATIEADETVTNKPIAEKKPAKIEADKPAVAVNTGRSAATPRPAPLPTVNEGGFRKAHASPAVRKFARELGADLGRINGTGNKGRILKEDVQNFIKQILSGSAAFMPAGGGLAVAPPPEIDFAAYGEIESKALSNINKLTGKYLHSSWVRIPHVTQFDEADITELEKYRKQLSEKYKDQGIKITIIAFLLKAVVSALQEFPRFNSSLDASGENLIFKKYFHIGVAVDTPDGLVVPVIQDVDKKNLLQLAEEIISTAQLAREKKLKIDKMKGGCFTISSLGGVGGTAFTPIINQPEVAILGVSRSSLKPVYQDNTLVPRLMLPLSLSYDHRVIDGVAAAKFTRFLGEILADAQRLPS